MTITATFLLAMLTALLTFLLGSLVLEAFWAIRGKAAAGGSPCEALRQLAPVPVRGPYGWSSSTIHRGGQSDG